MSYNTPCRVMLSAEEHGDVCLKQMCDDFIGRNYADVANTADWKGMLAAANGMRKFRDDFS